MVAVTWTQKQCQVSALLASDGSSKWQSFAGDVSLGGDEQSCAQAAPYTLWTDESSDSQHGNACWIPGGSGKGGGDWACPMGCTKINQSPWCSDDKDNTAPCRAPEILDPARYSDLKLS